MTSRRQAREEALQLLYAAELTGDPIRDLLELPPIIHENDDPLDPFTHLLAGKTTESAAEADPLIESHAKNWSFSRIALLDRLILRLAIAEFLHFPDIPPKVSIDEAVELAKKFSTGKSGRFVNGMLDSILNDLLKNKKLLKNAGTSSEPKSPKKNRTKQ